MNNFLVDGREFCRMGRLVRVCELAAPWYESIEDPDALILALKQVRERLHLFTFFQRVPHIVPKYNYHMEPYSVSVIKLMGYNDWWNNSIGKKTKYMVRKANNSGIEVRVAKLDDEFVKGISDVYNETPIRQGRIFPHYNDSLEKVRKENGTYIDRSVYIGAFYRNEFIGFARIVFEDDFTDILQLLSKISHRDKGVSNALIAKIVAVCAERGYEYIAYGDWDSGGLGDFKQHNGFVKMDLPRYYIPLNWIGAVALRLGMHRRFTELLPAKILSLFRNFRRRWYEPVTKLEQ